MTELSQEEKDRIRTELEYRKSVCYEINLLTSKRKRLSEFLAHPIIVTVLGGILLACIGAFLQNHYARQQAAITHETQINDKKVTIVANLPVQIYRDLALLVNRSYLRYDLEQWSHHKSYIGHLGRTRRETMEIYNKLVDEFAKSPRQAALLSEVQAWFCQPNVIDQAQKLEEKIEAFEKMMPAKINEDSVSNFDDETTAMSKRLILAMVDEVRAKTQCSSKK